MPVLSHFYHTFMQWLFPVAPVLGGALPNVAWPGCESRNRSKQGRRGLPAGKISPPLWRAHPSKGRSITVYIYLLRSCWKSQQSEGLAEEWSEHHHHHGELLRRCVRFFRPAKEHQCSCQPAGCLLRLADCYDYTVWSFHPVWWRVRRTLGRAQKGSQHHQRYRKRLLLQISQWVQQQAACEETIFKSSCFLIILWCVTVFFSTDGKGMTMNSFYSIKNISRIEISHSCNRSFYLTFTPFSAFGFCSWLESFNEMPEVIKTRRWTCFSIKNLDCGCATEHLITLLNMLWEALSSSCMQH